MVKKGTTKRQHYVPQFVLRRFSEDGATTALMVLATGNRVDRAPIARQCYEPYFYGSDQIMEQSFAAEETRIASLVGDLSRARLEALSESDLKKLRIFAHYQRARTRGAAEHLSRFAAEFVKSTLRGTVQLNEDCGFSADDVDLVDIRLNDAQNRALWSAAQSTPLLLDLAVKLISTERTPGFVIADHPVVAYNQFAEHHPRLKHYPTSTGVALKGLQLFMPLSPSVVLAVYDPGTYEYGGKSLVCKAGPGDVALLNRMQAVNAWECIFYDKCRVTDAHLDDLQHVRRRHPTLYKKNVAEGAMVRTADQARQLVVVSHPEIRIGAKFSFIRPLDGHSYEDYEGPAVPERSEELTDLARAYARRLEDEARRRAKEDGYSESTQVEP